jgi:hypothetical protein
MVFASWRRFVWGLATLLLGGLWAPSALGAIASNAGQFVLDLSSPTAQQQVDINVLDDNNHATWSTTVTDASGTTITVKFTAGPADRSAKLTWDTTDESVGVVTASAPIGKATDFDEVDEWEFLDVEFFDAAGNPIAVNITDVVVVDLFADEQRTYTTTTTVTKTRTVYKRVGWTWKKVTETYTEIKTTTHTETYDEVGGYKVNNGPTVSFTAADSQKPHTEGELKLDVDATATKITFVIPEGVDTTLDTVRDNDYAFQAIAFNYTPPVVAGGVPELSGRAASGPLALVLGALFVVSGRKRRRG